MTRFREVAASSSTTEEGQETSRIAKEILSRMEQQSPLALRVVYQLMKMGLQVTSTMENCMKLEMNAQLNMVRQADFQEWANHVRKHGDEKKAPPFKGWKHKSVEEVTTDEVDEILRETS